MVRPLLYISVTTTTHLPVFAKAMKRLLASSLLFVALMSLSSCSTPRDRAHVEYKRIVHFGKNGPIEPVLNELAKDGWRVVGYQVYPGDENLVLLEREKHP